MSKELVALTLGFLGVIGVAFGDESRYEPADAASYGNCPNPQLVCGVYHPGSELKTFCLYEQCFEMSYATEARVVAAEGEGLFPRTFMAWHSGELVPAGAQQCELQKSGNKTKISIPAGQTRCAVDLFSGGHLYHWHIASNPATTCLAWGECQSY